MYCNITSIFDITSYYIAQLYLSVRFQHDNMEINLHCEDAFKNFNTLHHSPLSTPPENEQEHELHTDTLFNNRVAFALGCYPAAFRGNLYLEQMQALLIGCNTAMTRGTWASTCPALLHAVMHYRGYEIMRFAQCTECACAVRRRRSTLF